MRKFLLKILNYFDLYTFEQIVGIIKHKNKIRELYFKCKEENEKLRLNQINLIEEIKELNKKLELKDKELKEVHKDLIKLLRKKGIKRG